MDKDFDLRLHTLDLKFQFLEDIRELLTYDEDTAGGLMAKELVKVEEGLSVLKCLNSMRAQARH